MSPDEPPFKFGVNFADLLRDSAAMLAKEIDDETRRMLEFLRGLALRAEPEDHPNFDERARGEAVYWLGEILRHYKVPKPRRFELVVAGTVIARGRIGHIVRTGEVLRIENALLEGGDLS